LAFVFVEIWVYVAEVDLQRNWVELQPPKVPKERPVAASPAVPLAKKPAGDEGFFMFLLALCLRRCL